MILLLQLVFELGVCAMDGGDRKCLTVSFPSWEYGPAIGGFSSLLKFKKHWFKAMALHTDCMLESPGGHFQQYISPG